MKNVGHWGILVIHRYLRRKQSIETLVMVVDKLSTRASNSLPISQPSCPLLLELDITKLKVLDHPLLRTVIP